MCHFDAIANIKPNIKTYNKSHYNQTLRHHSDAIIIEYCSLEEKLQRQKLF